MGNAGTVEVRLTANKQLETYLKLFDFNGQVEWTMLLMSLLRAREEIGGRTIQ